ncbi:MAG: hypothetical protein PUD25_04990 [Bacilli bacterium]|nr:hypothetical protein [Bacilli bacterium]
MLETFFTDEDIKDIYDELVIYSIKKYEENKNMIESLDKESQKKFQKQYKIALLAMKEREINPETLKNRNIQTLKASLDNYQQIYHTILKLNQPTTNEIALQMKEILLSTLSIPKNESEKASLLFDFTTNYFKYSYDCYKYCNQIPFVSEYDFDFKDNIPIDSNYNSILLMGQGLCTDIANFIAITGRNLGLNIEVISANHNDNFHALNKITFSNGEVSLIDATAFIKDKVPKSSCFLVSEAKLNQQNNYSFTEELPSTITLQEPILDTTEKAKILSKEIKKNYPGSNDINRKRNY